MSVLIVTRHQGLVTYLIAEGLVPSDVEVVSHASPENVADKHVWGVLPHSLSCLTRSFTEIPLDLPAELRGVELSEAQVRQYAGQPVTYKVVKTHRLVRGSWQEEDAVNDPPSWKAIPC